MENSNVATIGTRPDALKTAPEQDARVTSVLGPGAPTPTALYRHFDADGALLYVGISLSPTYRLSQHCDASPWFRRIASIRVEWLESRPAALDAERRAIQAESPEFNIVHARPSSARDAYLAEMAEDSCAELTQRVTRFHPSYSPADAASALGATESAVRFAMAAGDLPYYPCGQKAVSVSGWSLIAYLEALQSGAAKLPRVPKRDDGRNIPMPNMDWLVENHGNVSIASWIAAVEERWASQTDIAA